MPSRWQPSGPGTMLVCGNGHTMQFRLVNSPDAGLAAVCTVEGCGDTALLVARYQEPELGRDQAARAPAPAGAPAPAAGGPAVPAASLPPVPAPAAAPESLQPPIHVRAQAPSQAPLPAAQPAQAPVPQPAAAPAPAPAPALTPAFSRELVSGPSIRDLIEHSSGFKESQAQAKGYSQPDFERIWPDGAPYQVPLGSVAGSLPVDIRGRPATLGLPEGWRAWSAPEMLTLPAKGDRRHHIVMERTEVTRDRIFRLGMMSLPLGPPFDLLAAVLECERQYGLPIAARVVALDFAGSTGYLWHIQGRVPGRILGKPDNLVPMHLSEMQAPVGRYVMQLTAIAPVDKAREAVTAIHTVIASWRWLA